MNSAAMTDALAHMGIRSYSLVLSGSRCEILTMCYPVSIRCFGGPPVEHHAKVFPGHEHPCNWSGLLGIVA